MRGSSPSASRRACTAARRCASRGRWAVCLLSLLPRLPCRVGPARTILAARLPLALINTNLPCPAAPQVKILAAERDVYAAQVEGSRGKLLMKVSAQGEVRVACGPWLPSCGMAQQQLWGMLARPRVSCGWCATRHAHRCLPAPAPPARRSAPATLRRPPTAAGPWQTAATTGVCGPPSEPAPQRRQPAARPPAAPAAAAPSSGTP